MTSEAHRIRARVTALRHLAAAHVTALVTICDELDRLADKVEGADRVVKRNEANMKASKLKPASKAARKTVRTTAKKMVKAQAKKTARRRA